MKSPDALKRTGRRVRVGMGRERPHYPGDSSMMWDCAAQVGSRAFRTSKTEASRRRRPALRPWPEMLEDRRLLSACSWRPSPTSAYPPSRDTPCRSMAAARPTIRRSPSRGVSGDPDISASVAQGPFWTLDVQNKDPTNREQLQRRLDLSALPDPDSRTRSRRSKSSRTTGITTTRISSGSPADSPARRMTSSRGGR